MLLFIENNLRKTPQLKAVVNSRLNDWKTSPRYISLERKINK